MDALQDGYYLLIYSDATPTDLSLDLRRQSLLGSITPIIQIVNGYITLASLLNLNLSTLTSAEMLRLGLTTSGDLLPNDTALIRIGLESTKKYTLTVESTAGDGVGAFSIIRKVGGIATTLVFNNGQVGQGITISFTA